MPLYFIAVTRLAIIMLLGVNAAGAPPFCSLPGGSSCPTGSHGTFVMWRRGGLTLEVRGVWACSPQCFRDRRGGGGMERVGKTERRELPALLSMCLFSEKCSPSCTSTMPAQNDRGYCTPNHCVVGRERERSRDREREKM